MRQVGRRVITGVIGAHVIVGLVASLVGAPVLASPAPMAPMTGSSPAATTRCGQVDGGVLYVGESVDPEIRSTVSVAGRTYQAADLDALTLATLELAWIARQDVCIAEDASQVPVGATAEIDVCGDVLVGATFFLYRTGTGAVAPDGQDDHRQGFFHDAFFGFRALEVSADPAPPNLYTALNMATYRADQDDCLRASLAWTEGSETQVTASLSTPVCVVAMETSESTATFFSPFADRSFAFRRTPGSTVDPAFDQGERAGATVTAERGLDGRFTIEPRDVDACPSADGTPIPSVAPAPSRTPVPSPSEAAAASPSPSPSPAPSVSAEATPSPSPTPGVGVVAGGSPIPRSSLGTDPTSTTGARRLDASRILLLGGMLLAAGVFAALFVLGRRPRTADGGSGPRVEPPAPEPRLVQPLEAFGLTPREREVIAMVATGMTNREIAEALFISESTAGVHVSNILGKLGVASRTEAARYAIEAAKASSPPAGPIH